MASKGERVREIVREREREKEKQRERENKRETKREGEREREKDKDKQRDKERDKEREKKERKKEKERKRKKERKKERDKERQRERKSKRERGTERCVLYMKEKEFSSRDINLIMNNTKFEKFCKYSLLLDIYFLGRNFLFLVANLHHKYIFRSIEFSTSHGRFQTFPQNTTIQNRG